jgi:RNA polymerase sigma-70 factor (sigma-E family)
MPSPPEQEYVDFVSARLPALRRVAYNLCGDGHQADDLVQEAVTKLYVRWPLHGIDNLDGYVRTILVRTFIDERRRGWWKVRLFGGLPDEQPQAAGSGAEDRTMLRAALAKVPPRQHAVLVLRFLCDLPILEVAEILGCSAGTVKSQTSHGLTAMRRLLGDTPADLDAGVAMKEAAR